MHVCQASYIARGVTVNAGSTPARAGDALRSAPGPFRARGPHPGTSPSRASHPPAAWVHGQRKSKCSGRVVRLSLQAIAWDLASHVQLVEVPPGGTKESASVRSLWGLLGRMPARAEYPEGYAVGHQNPLLARRSWNSSTLPVAAPLGAGLPVHLV